MSVEDRVEWRARMLSIGMMRSRPAVREFLLNAISRRVPFDDAELAIIDMAAAHRAAQPNAEPGAAAA